MTPLVTVGMPVRNGEPFLVEALDTALSQTLGNFELLISDNASDDGTEAICREYAKRDRRIRYVRQPRNVGATANFNILVDMATAPYFCWMAADDRAEPSFLERLAGFLDRHPDVGLCTCDVVHIDAAGRRIGEVRLERIRPDADWPAARLAFFEFPATTYLAIYGLYRTPVLRSTSLVVPLTRKRVLFGTESPLLAQIACRSRIVALPEPLKQYRWTGPSTHHPAGLSQWDARRAEVALRVGWLSTVRSSGLPAADRWALTRHILSGYVAPARLKRVLRRWVRLASR